MSADPPGGAGEPRARLPAEVVRLAVWSGPRNISTAMMRAFENRPDCEVVDEPFYGYYLQRTGLDHPGREDIVAAMACDWRTVAAALTEDVPAPCGVYYQKHMTHHMLDEVDLTFTDALVNCFLVREPGRMIASYARVRPDFTVADLGLPQQWRIFEFVRARSGVTPLVLDAARILADPEGQLRRLCAHAGVPFDQAMLNWPAGPRPSDGVWARYWYAAVEASSGFADPPAGTVSVPARYAAIHAEADDYYARLTAG
jgi:hypothetical protein